MKPFAWVLLVLLSFSLIHSGVAAAADSAKPAFPKPLEDYHDEQIPGVFSKLAHRRLRPSCAWPP